MSGSLASLGVHLQPRNRETACPTHGAYTARCFIGTVWTRCPACVTEEDVRERAQTEAQRRDDEARAWRQRIGEAGIPERFQDRSLTGFVAETPEQERALRFAEEYARCFDTVQRTGRSAIFLGRPGTGKTHLAAAIGLDLMMSGRTVLFAGVLRAVRRVKDTWARGAKETESQAIAALAYPDLLILDEVGVQFGSEAEKLILFDVLNERYEKRRPTLLLSNLTLEEIRAYLGERIFDRLREDGGEAIPFAWESYRGRAAA